MKKKHLLLLKQWANSTNKNSIESELLNDGEFIWFLSDCVMNVLSGVVQAIKKLKKFEKTLRQLSNRKVGKTERLKIFQSPSGNNRIQLIALPCIEYLERNAY